MPRSAAQLREDALRIWRAGLEGVRSEPLIREHLRFDGRWLLAGDSEPIDLGRVRQIAVVGAGKAGAGMAEGLQEALSLPPAAAKPLLGLVNVPADCLRPLRHIRLHAARPAGINEPTTDGVAGAAEMLQLVESLGPDDLCIALISGGGSALLPLPPPEISLADKLAVTRHLAAAGADIRQLNTVRKQLSRIKGGGLARACRAGTLLALIISDVLGDPLDLIASGPTVPNPSTPDEAVAILREFDPGESAIPATVYQYLESRRNSPRVDAAPTCRVSNIILANNATAIDAAGQEAERLGYSAALTAATTLEGDVEPIGRHLAEMALSMRGRPGPDCLISGGEGVVRLAAAAERGLGGRNQQLALAALIRLAQADPGGIALVSAGTDGEDGPTDAAGAIVDPQVIARAAALGLEAADFLRRDDAYHFFEQAGGLFKTGPTHTNVGDVRVLTVDHSPPE